MDYRLILEKPRGFSTKFPGFIEIMNFWNYFLKEILIDSIHGAVDRAWLGPPWTSHGWTA
jgi:hypothetical protein